MLTNDVRVNQARILFGCFLGVAAGFSSSYFYSIGLLLIPMARDLGLSRGQLTLALVVASMTGSAMAPLIGRAVDRFSARSIGPAALVGLSFGLVLCAWLATGLFSLLACSIVIAVLGAGSTSVSFSRLVVDAFERRRGLALAVMQTGAGLGAFVVPFVLSFALRDGDWRTAYYLLALIVFVAAIVVRGAIVPRRGVTPVEAVSAANQVSTVAQSVFRTRQLFILAATFGLAGAAITGSVIHLVPMMIDGGLSAARAGGLASLMGIMLICGRLSTGWLLDRLVAEYITAALFVMTAIGLVLLAFKGATIALFGAVVVGFAIGSEVDLLCYLTSRHFPRNAYGTAYGALFGVFSFGSALGASLMGFAYDYFGGYRVAFLLAAAVLLIAAMLAVVLRKLCPEVATSDALCSSQALRGAMIE